MGKISIYKVVSDVKEKYIEASGDEEAVKFGNVAQKVYDAISSGGSGGYGGVAVIPIQSIVEAMPTNTTVTV